MVRTFIIMLVLWGTALGSSYGQSYRIGLSGLYGSPAFGSFFKDGYESRLGVRLNFDHYRSERLTIGGSLEHIKFLPYIDNPISITEAKYYALTFRLGYNILSETKNRLEPFVETGYYLMIYNPDALTGQSFGVNLGGDYFFRIEESYGLSLGLRWTSVFDKFGKSRNPNEVSHMQIFFVQGGFVFYLK